VGCNAEEVGFQFVQFKELFVCCLQAFVHPHQLNVGFIECLCPVPNHVLQVFLILFHLLPVTPQVLDHLVEVGGKGSHLIIAPHRHRLGKLAQPQILYPRRQIRERFSQSVHGGNEGQQSENVNDEGVNSDKPCDLCNNGRHISDVESKEKIVLLGPLWHHHTQIDLQDIVRNVIPDLFGFKIVKFAQRQRPDDLMVRSGAVTANHLTVPVKNAGINDAGIAADPANNLRHRLSGIG